MMNRTQLVDYLAATPLLGSLEFAQLEEVAGETEYVRLAGGETLVEHGGPGGAGEPLRRGGARLGEGAESLWLDTPSERRQSGRDAGAACVPCAERLLRERGHRTVAERTGDEPPVHRVRSRPGAVSMDPQ